ncbi:hypothetical protein ON010_g9903 [Phytophthora cinnamomi]|nr:hypothetical protein ON010_g9903 [Phytophthora cinnamomi]
MSFTGLPKLFAAATLDGRKSPLKLKHRVVMAPMTRLRMGDDGVPGAVVVEFYTQRATDGGLLVTEGTNISATARGYYGAPGIFNAAQIEGWQAVTKAVHAKAFRSSRRVASLKPQESRSWSSPRPEWQEAVHAQLIGSSVPANPSLPLPDTADATPTASPPSLS